MHGFEQAPAYLEVVRLQAQAMALFAEWRARFDQVDWYHLKPEIMVGGGVLALAALLLFAPAKSSDEPQSHWANVAVAGRWVVWGAALVVLAAWKVRSV